MKSRRLALSTGLTYHVLEWDGPPAAETTFVLVHGFLDLAFGWHEVADRLAARVHVIAPDLRGHGDTDWIGPGGYYHFFDYIADLDDLIPRVIRKRLVLVGHSMGGSVATYWAGTRPEKVSALALLEGLGPPDQDDTHLPGRTAQWIDAWRTARAKTRAMPSLADAASRLRKHDPLLSESLSLKLAAAGTRPVEGGEGLVWKHDPLHITMGPYPFRRSGAEQFWKRITCPTLIVDGEKSAGLPEPERAQRRAAFVDHRHAILPGAAHMMQRHQPDALAKLLLELA